MKTCDNCGYTENPNDAKYCIKCNNSLENKYSLSLNDNDYCKNIDCCSHCGYPYSPLLNICPNCRKELKNTLDIPYLSLVGGSENDKILLKQNQSIFIDGKQYVFHIK